MNKLAASGPRATNATSVEWGKLPQIHIDYHVKQFAA